MATIEKKTIKQAHNLTAEELSDLQQQQASGEEQPTVSGNGEEKGYKIPAYEKHLVHAKITIPQFDPATGEDQSTSVVQKFNVQEFKNMTKTQAFAGRKVSVLHNGGDADVESVGAKDFLRPQVVSGPGAGLDLTKDYSKESAASLKKTYKEVFPGVAEADIPTTKDKLLAELQDMVAYLQDEQKREEMEQIEKDRINRDLAASTNKGATAASIQKEQRKAGEE